MVVYVYDDQQGMTVLEAMLKQLFGESLLFHGYASAGDLMLAAEHHYFDIVFANLEFNGTDGMRLLGALQRHYPKSNFIGVANTESLHDALLLHRIHASGYLIKPYKAEQLSDLFMHLRFPVADSGAMHTTNLAYSQLNLRGKNYGK